VEQSSGECLLRSDAVAADTNGSMIPLLYSCRMRQTAKGSLRRAREEESYSLGIDRRYDIALPNPGDSADEREFHALLRRRRGAECPKPTYRNLGRVLADLLVGEYRVARICPFARIPRGDGGCEAGANPRHVIPNERAISIGAGPCPGGARLRRSRRSSRRLCWPRGGRRWLLGRGSVHVRHGLESNDGALT
jgi:hypothetical protein